MNVGRFYQEPKVLKLSSVQYQYQKDMDWTRSRSYAHPTIMVMGFLEIYIIGLQNYKNA